MSGYELAKGRIVELFPELDTPEKKIRALAEFQHISLNDLIYKDREGNYEFDYIEHENYMLADNRLFDISDAIPGSNADPEHQNITKIDTGVYDIDLYYYNGGTDMVEIVDKHLRKERESE